MKWTTFLGSSLVIVAAACGSTPDDDGSADGGGSGGGGGGGAVCDAYATYCKIPSDSQKKVEDCRSAVTDAKCGAQAADLYRCLMDNQAKCDDSYELDDTISACESTRSAYTSCLRSEDTCTTDVDCTTASRPRCKAATVCTECLADVDCAGNSYPHCRIETEPSSQNRCEECVTDEHCTDPSEPVCSNDIYRCAQCNTSADCKDPSRPYCVGAPVTTGSCAECNGAPGGCPDGKTCINYACQ